MEPREFNGYTVTEHGEIYNTKTGRRIKPYIHHVWGYLIVCLRIEGKQKNFPVHRLVAQLFIPNPSNLPQVDHISSVRTDNSVVNLQWVTASTNQQKRSVKISPNNTGMPALTDAQVYDIKYTNKDLSLSVLSKMYNCSVTCLSLIRNGKRYKHI
jgi:hypothetical protein